MAAFFENPLFFFVDETEPILPIIRPSEYSDSGRKIVELADVGCDTETTFPIHFLRGKFNRRRGGVEGFESARRITKGRNERLTNFSTRTATILDDFGDRKEKYMKGKWRNNRKDVYAADLEYNSYVDDPYDDWEFSNNVAGYNDYYTDFVRSRNMIGRSQKERPSQNARYSRNYEVPYSRGNRASREREERTYYQRKNTCPLWFANNDERNVYGTCDTNGRLPLSEHRKRMRIFSGADNDFNRDAKSRRNRIGAKQRERENASFDYVNSVKFSKNDGSDFILLEDEPNYEESISSNSATLNNHRHLWKTISQNLDPQQTRVDTTDSENSEFIKTREKNSFVDSPFPKNPNKGTRYETSKNDATMEKLKTFQSYLPDINTSRVRSAGITTDQRLSNMCSTEKIMTNVKLDLAVEERKNDATEKRIETTNSTSARTDNRRRRNNFSNTQIRLCNKPLNDPVRSAKDASKRAAASRGNERMYKKNNAGSRVGNANKNGEIDRADQTVPSRLAPEEVTENEGASISELSSTSPRTKVEEKKISRLPVRTWKRMQTREPVALHLKSETTTEAVGGKFQDADVVLESAQLSKSRSAEDGEEREKMARDRASRRHGDLKPNDRNRTRGSFIADKPWSAFSDLKGLKGTKNLNTSKGTSEQRRKWN